MLDFLLGIVAPLLEYAGIATGISTEKGSEGLGFLALAQHEMSRKEGTSVRESWLEKHEEGDRQ